MKENTTTRNKSFVATKLDKYQLKKINMGYIEKSINIKNPYLTLGNRMNITIGKTDQIIRVLIGLTLVVLVLTDSIGAWGWLGFVLVSTGMLRICPLYSLFSINTCSQ